jgi:tetratricopeptide (TPR) repeat protein
MSADHDRVIKESSKAIKKNPSDIEAYRARGRAWQEKGDYDQAILDCTKAIEKSQMIWLDVELHQARAQLWLKTGKVDRYEEDLAKAKELSDSIPGGQQGLD